MNIDEFEQHVLKTRPWHILKPGHSMAIHIGLQIIIMANLAWLMIYQYPLWWLYLLIAWPIGTVVGKSQAVQEHRFYDHVIEKFTEEIARKKAELDAHPGK